MKLKRGVGIVFLLLLINLAFAADVHMEVEVLITPDDIFFQSAYLFEGDAKDNVLDYDEFYTVRIYSFKNELLDVYNFSKSMVMFTDTFNTSDSELAGAFEIEERYETLSFPYYPNIERLEVWDGENRKLEVDLSEFATCNENELCEEFETKENCPSDCLVEKPELEEMEEVIPIAGIEEEVEPSFVEKNKNYIYVGLGVLVFLILVLILTRKRKKKFR